MRSYEYEPATWGDQPGYAEKAATTRQCAWAGGWSDGAGGTATPEPRLHQVKQLVDEDYPDKDLIVLVMDNLAPIIRLIIRAFEYGSRGYRRTCGD